MAEEGSILICQKCADKHGSVCRVIVKGDSLIIMDGAFACGEYVRE